MTVVARCAICVCVVAVDVIDVLRGYGSGSQSSEADENSNDADYTVQTSALVISHWPRHHSAAAVRHFSQVFSALLHTFF